MQPEDIEIELPSPCLNGLDSALQRLGMLATSTESRREYLREACRRKPYLNMVRINTRYKPYTIRERHRTRSENNDGEKDAGLVGAVVDDIVEDSMDLAQLKKAKSLESIAAESNAEVDLHGINFPELEVVSNSIQNLKVVE